MMRFLKLEENKTVNLDKIEMVQVTQTRYDSKLNIFFASGEATTITFDTLKQATQALDLISNIVNTEDIPLELIKSNLRDFMMS